MSLTSNLTFISKKRLKQFFHEFGLPTLVSVLVGGHSAGLDMLEDEPEMNFDLAILGFQGETLLF